MRPATSLALLGTGAILVWSGITGQDVFKAISTVVSGKLQTPTTGPGGKTPSGNRLPASRVVA